MENIESYLKNRNINYNQEQLDTIRDLISKENTFIPKENTFIPKENTFIPKTAETFVRTKRTVVPTEHTSLKKNTFTKNKSNGKLIAGIIILVLFFIIVLFVVLCLKGKWINNSTNLNNSWISIDQNPENSNNNDL